ncbi:Uncharacterised protein [Serratia ficaria]|uniref:Uncharacterized protein n=1 Tax=Serratia ficaria TaxID=61651 RepID=A0A240C0Z2_SERFI|nr:hypothetical protein C7332_3005 [Serratia ficaria]CAI0702955.1 Uncharacterised protein [Serratia ficaria]CAI0806385.1 Uncharacterised protein [Serratia ficaria]CAI0812518.1 Uncharacterised protein [Serratia ficaria]CAI0819185.1 Uncharacterised protein [Serratia ficaria]
MKKTYKIVAIIIGLFLSSFLLAGAGVSNDYLYSAPENLSKFIVSIWFSISIILTVYKLLYYLFEQQR